jgi:hypothetical protein
MMDSCLKFANEMTEGTAVNWIKMGVIEYF